MTPEPAQPAESPEARALAEEAALRMWSVHPNDLDAKGFIHKSKGGKYDNPRAAYYASEIMGVLAATTARPTERDCERCQGNGEIVTDWNEYLHTKAPEPTGEEGTADCPDCGGTGSVDARPTERGAVEALLRQAANLVYRIEAAGAVEHEGLNFDRWKATARALAPDLRAALTPPATVAATDQAGEVERLREALKPFAVEADEQERVTSFRDGDCVIPRTKITIGQLRRARAALATQTAIGPTMGGEDGLREALEDIEKMLTPAGNVWLGTEPKWQTDAYARARAALQNGGER